MSRLMYFATVITLMTVFVSCRRTITGTGPLSARSVQTKNFSGLSLFIPADLTLVMADSFNCIVTAQQNIFEAIEVETDGNALEIKSDYNLETHEPVSIVVSMPSIERLQVNGPGKVKFLNTAKGGGLRLYINGSGDILARAEMEEVRCEINGSGTVTLDGSSQIHHCNINGSGDLHAYNFISEKADININGSGDAELHVSSKLKADVKGSGTVTYKGDPHLITEILGSGQIKKAE